MSKWVTPHGLIEFNHRHMYWKPIRGRTYRMELDADYHTACIVPGPQNSVRGIVVFMRDGSLLHLAMPSMAQISSREIGGWRVEHAVIVHHRGRPFIVMSRLKELKVVDLEEVGQMVSEMEFEETIDLMFTEFDQLVLIHGICMNVIPFDELIPPPQSPRVSSG